MSHRQISQSQSYRPVTVSISTYSTRKSTSQGKATTLARRQVRFIKYAVSVTP